MDDRVREWSRDGYLVSTDRSRLDAGRVLALLQSTHWAGDLTAGRLAMAIANSVSFGVYHEATLVGFGRVITDLATYGYITDVVVATAERGRGLGAWLTECMVGHPELQGFRRMALVTRDAEALYTAHGFRRGAGALVYMERSRPSEP
jgi:ribosomal protein S18 acetylase RimI-like enzyme